MLLLCRLLRDEVEGSVKGDSAGGVWRGQDLNGEGQVYTNMQLRTKH